MDFREITDFQENMISRELSDSLGNMDFREIIELRKQIHRNPEPGRQEVLTKELIKGYLTRLEIDFTEIGTAGLVGEITLGHGGKVLALRADMDALPVTEETDCDFISEVPGFMHACGHDVHTAALLGAAAALAELKNSRDCNINGTVKLIFEADEEDRGGAREIIKSGILDDVSAVFGAHVRPDLPEGHIGIRYGSFYAASDMFDVNITGKSAHGAEPEKGIDALLAAARAICDIQSIPSLMEDPCIVSTGTLNAGTARNIISDYASFTGILRTFGPENRQKVKKLFCEKIESVCAELGALPDIRLMESYSGIVNQDCETSLTEVAAVAAFGNEAVHIIDTPLFTTEDFGYYVERFGGSFYHIGAGCSSPLHSPQFLPTDEALIAAVKMHTAVAVKYLEKNNG